MASDNMVVLANCVDIAMQPSNLQPSDLQLHAQRKFIAIYKSKMEAYEELFARARLLPL